MLFEIQPIPNRPDLSPSSYINPDDISSIDEVKWDNGKSTRTLITLITEDKRVYDNRPLEQFMKDMQMSKTPPTIVTPSKTKTLPELLEDIQVSNVDDDVSLDISTWYYVNNDEGIIAYFGDIKDALAFRLGYINKLLNS